MKNRIIIPLIALSLTIWSCDEPKPFDNSSFIYNPFAFEQDTLQIVEEIRPGIQPVEWGHHLRAWVGETQYYKSGFTMDFSFSDTSLSVADADSIQIQFRHQFTFPENGADTLLGIPLNFDFYESTGISVDIGAGAYGSFLSRDTMTVAGSNNYWSYTLPDSTIMAGDTTISLGIFPGESGSMTVLYGGGSSIRPSLVFYYHEPDTAGEDSATTHSPFLADSLYMHLIKQAGVFDPQYDYLSQLSSDTLTLTLDLQNMIPTSDTLIHMISSTLLLAVDLDESALYIPTLADSVQLYNMNLEDPESGISVNFSLGQDGAYYGNELKTIIQRALDDRRSIIELTLSSNHTGFDPGFIAISREADESAIFVSTSLAVRP